MILGPTLILRPKGARMLVKKQTILSSYDFGGWQWSDGKPAPSMIPDKPSLLKSPRVGILYWQEECEEVGEMEECFLTRTRCWKLGEEVHDKTLIREWKRLPYGEEPSELDYLQALESGMGDTAERIYSLRMRLWWKGNDPIRRASEVKPRGFFSWMAKEAPVTHGKLPDVHLQNLEILLGLIPEEDPLLKAEVLRELGRFSEAAALIAHGIPRELQYHADTLSSLIEAEDVNVAKVINDGSFQREEYARVLREVEQEMTRFRELVIGSGIATEQTVDRVIYNMALTSFRAMAADYPTISRAFFNPQNRSK